jgi:Fe2+ or Zn2+ uptake regulation protein
MSYYNTTNLRGNELKSAQDRARTQEQQVLDIFTLAQRPLSASQVLQRLHLLGKRPPVTSVRRAISNLTRRGELTRTDNRIVGPYRAKEYQWTLSEGKQANG